MKIKIPGFRWRVIPLLFIVVGLFVFGGRVFNTARNTNTSSLQESLSDVMENASQANLKIALLEEKLAQNPGSIALRNRLARAYIQKARENGDASYFNRADAALIKSLEQEPADAEALGLRAWVFLFKHEFKAAAEWAEKARMRQPQESWNYGVLSDAYLEMGEYPKAVTYAQKMVDLRPDQGSYSRAAHLRSLHGDPDGAIELWQLAIRAGAPDAENTAWCQVELGDEYFNQGRLKEAEEAYQASLKIFPGYHRGLAGLAKVRAAERRWAESARFYQKAAEVIPYPHYLSALGDIYLEMGKPEEATKQYDLVEHIAKLDQVNQVLYNRDLALFYADHDMNLESAIRIAEKELELRKDIYTYDILAWVYYKNNRYPEAQAAIQEALKLGTKDARLFYHVGMISLALGNKGKSKTYLKRALATNPYFYPVYPKKAKEALEVMG